MRTTNPSRSTRHDPVHRFDIIGSWLGFEDRARHQPGLHFHVDLYQSLRDVAMVSTRATTGDDLRTGPSASDLECFANCCWAYVAAWM